MLEVTKQIQSYTELLLNLWYLDDGVFIGKAEEVRKALDILDHLGPGQGLHLNSKKMRDHHTTLICTPNISFPRYTKRQAKHRRKFRHPRKPYRIPQTLRRIPHDQFDRTSRRYISCFQFN